MAPNLDTAAQLVRLLDTLSVCPIASDGLIQFHDSDGSLITAARRWAEMHERVLDCRENEVPGRRWCSYEVNLGDPGVKFGRRIFVVIHDSASNVYLDAPKPVAVDGEWSPAQHASEDLL